MNLKKINWVAVGSLAAVAGLMLALKPDIFGGGGDFYSGKSGTVKGGIAGTTEEPATKKEETTSAPSDTPAPTGPTSWNEVGPVIQQAMIEYSTKKEVLTRDNGGLVASYGTASYYEQAAEKQKIEAAGFSTEGLQGSFDPETGSIVTFGPSKKEPEYVTMKFTPPDPWEQSVAQSVKRGYGTPSTVRGAPIEYSGIIEGYNRGEGNYFAVTSMGGSGGPHFKTSEAAYAAKTKKELFRN